MKSLVTSFFGVPSTAMNPLQREAHFSKIENDRRKFERRQEERCKCGHGHFWHMNDERCLATALDECSDGPQCKCVEFELQPDRRVP